MVPNDPPTKEVRTMIKRNLSSSDLNTILAALRYWQKNGMGEPANRSDELHDIATNGGEDISLDDSGIDDLRARLNFG